MNVSIVSDSQRNANTRAVRDRAKWKRTYADVTVAIQASKRRLSTSAISNE